MSEYKTQSILPVMAQHLAHLIENTEKTSIAFQHEITETLILVNIAQPLWDLTFVTVGNKLLERLSLIVLTWQGHNRSRQTLICHIWHLQRYLTPV